MKISDEIVKQQFVQREYGLAHSTYDNELDFYQLVSSGDVKAVSGMLQTGEEDEAVLAARGILSDDKIRNQRYHEIVLVAMISRFCIEEGMEEMESYNLSDLDENLDREYKIKEFIGYNEEWLDFVALCRIGKQTNKFDMVTGGIADDKVFNTIDLYFSGNISKEEALKRLKFIHPNHQICILNQDILNKHLHFLQSDEII